MEKKRRRGQECKIQRIVFVVIEIGILFGYKCETWLRHRMGNAILHPQKSCHFSSS